MSPPLTKPQRTPDFTGIWYGNQPLGTPYGYKYSGGMATYPQQHAPIAVYRPEAHRTYFVFGSSTTLPPSPEQQKQIRGEVPGETVCCISYFDHATRTLAQPRQLLRRNVIDAHENPVLCIDAQGHLIVFCPAHGSGRPSDILRSREPHNLDAFEIVRTFPVGDNFSYPQPWWLDTPRNSGVTFLHTLYENGQRRLAVANSPDGLDWSAWNDRRILVRMAKGSYEVSWPDGRGGIGAAFDLHPDTDEDVPLNRRTNLYYMHTRDAGRTWTNAAGQPLDLPLADVDNPALVYDAARDNKLVYIKDVQFDERGEPMILYLTASSAWPGPEGGPHTWRLAHHVAGQWRHHTITTSTHCYDHGSLLLLAPDDWRLIAPTAPGPDIYAAGGEMILWQSRDQGQTWSVVKAITADSPRNHTYARRPLNAHRDFACLWADGRGYEPSESRLYFCDADGRAFAMPERFDETSAEHASACAPIPLA